MVTILWTSRCDSCAMFCNVTGSLRGPAESSRGLEGAGLQVATASPSTLGSRCQGAGMRITAGAVGATVALLALLHHPVATRRSHPAGWWRALTEAGQQAERLCPRQSCLATVRPSLAPTSKSSRCHHTTRARAPATRTIVVEAQVVAKLVGNNHSHLRGAHPSLPKGDTS